MRDTTQTSDPISPLSSGPLAGSEPDTGRPIDDPSLADRATTRWQDAPGTEAGPASQQAPAAAPDAQPLANPDGSPNVMPSASVETPMSDPEQRRHGTPQDQAARPIGSDVGRDNIKAGRGGGAQNPALAEGGDNG
jgi:hypothetical protein